MTESPDEIEAVHARHPEVEHDHVGIDGIEDGEPVLAVDSLEDLELALEGHPVQGPPGRIVVYHEHGRHWDSPLRLRLSQARCQLQRLGTTAT